MRIRLSCTPLVVIACGLWPLAVIAQNETNRAQQPSQPQSQAQSQSQAAQAGQNRPDLQLQGSAGSSNDAQLASCLIVDNQNEIALSQFALPRLQSEEAKRFAQMMIDDHQKMLTTLQKFSGGGQAGRDQSQNANPGHDASHQASQPGVIGGVAQADRPSGNVTTTYKLDASAGQSGGLNLANLKQELGAQCLQSKRRELEQKQGAEFDMCFIGMQIGDHMMVLDELQVFQNHASPEFRSKLAEAQQTVQHHLDQAKQIAKSQMASAQGGTRQTSSPR